MEAFALLLLIVIAACFVLPLVAIAKAASARRSVEDFKTRLRNLEAELQTLKRAPGEPSAERPFAAERETAEREPFVAPIATPSEARPVSVPPPLPEEVAAVATSTPPPIPPQPPSGESAPTQPLLPAINWEQFMGAKLFAWIGGLALFLGVAFFVKYSFEHNLIPPEVRVAIGFAVGLALIVGGLGLRRKENVVTAQTLCATGILILYAVTFACRSFYHFAFFDFVPTFLLMTLITAVAFLLAVRMNAIVVAILGMAGGFLTPILLSTGQDNPLGLFGYIALLDIGLLMVARRKEWSALPVLGAVGTVLMQVGWVGQFFLREHYFLGNKVLVPMAIFLGFEFLFSAALVSTKRTSKSEGAFSVAAIGMGGAAIACGFYFLSFQAFGYRPALLLSYLFLADIGLLAIVFMKEKLAAVSTVTGLAVFAFLAIWTGWYLTTQNLYVALAAFFVFALLHSTASLVLQRTRRIEAQWWSHLFPALALVLVLMPIFSLSEVSFLVWPMVFCVDLLAIFVAVATGALLPIFAVLLLTFVVIGGWIFRIPIELTGLPTSLFLLGCFAVFFLLAAIWACRPLLASGPSGVMKTRGKLFGALTDPANFAIQLPTLSATLPFLLLIMVTLRLPLTNPAPVFGMALMFVVLLLGMAKIFSLDLLSAVGLGSTLALEYAWHSAHFNPDHVLLALAWYIGFAAVFTIFPFLFQRQFAGKTVPWAAAALAAPLHFFLVYDAIRTAYPNGMLGLVPAAFAVPSLLGLIVLLKRTPAESPARNAHLALFGGAALFFITLIFPIQFDRQWITLGWALEGAALCWLFHRVPHPGLRLVGTALLITAFVRLALNPAVLSYHARSATPIFNWYLYTYGIVSVCLFAGARLLASPRNLVLGRNAQPLLYALGTILAFLLLNIEIADYFNRTGMATLTFQFSGNFARDMSYSIAWALFALLLLVIGIRKTVRPVRYASLGLLGVTILKLFLHDLSQLDQLYRIAAFVVVAIIAIFASFLYQRFLGLSAKQTQ
ncbi:MAG TPA: DUF2339 domain-containing protein [Candidatus Baltobacteraceae bacterium]|nr:DUF2339 domain-containing protein [Candidatus Baltobacteraceae bacterium]